MSIYTRTGDKGKTSLLLGIRVSKADLRVETCGTIDELNSALGVVLSTKYLVSSIKKELIKIQKDSWHDFLTRELNDTIKTISPISDYTSNNWQLELGELSFDPTPVSPDIAKHKGLNYVLPVKIKAKLTNKRITKIYEDRKHIPARRTQTFVRRCNERASNQCAHWNGSCAGNTHRPALRHFSR